MSLQMPNLDDRTFDDLLAEALEKIRTDLHTGWNDLSPGDPGVVLLEAFAYLTEQMIYRLNRVPEKAYIAFLRMMGVGLKPPYAAHVKLSFWQEPQGEGSVHIPIGTRVSSQAGGGGSAASRDVVTFMTVEELEVPPECNNPASAVKALAYQAAWVEEEFTSNGLPGQEFSIARPPMLADAPGLQLRLGIESAQSEWQAKDWIPIYGGNHYHDWKETPNFAGGSQQDAHVFRVDRQAGRIYFAPAAYLYDDDKKSTDGHESGHIRVIASKKTALAAIPEKGRKIRVRYAIGGGLAGNIPIGMLTAIQGSSGLSAPIKVTNAAPARGGMDAETLPNALVRGPQEIFTQERLITARDFERTVLRAGRSDFARARALALAELWEHAAPGMVGVSLVPALRGPQYNSANKFSKAELESQQDILDELHVLTEMRNRLEAQSPLGVHSQLEWAHYKQVSISAEVTIWGGDKNEIEDRLVGMLHRKISPLPLPAGEKKLEIDQAGWGFGDALYLADIARWIISSEPNLRMLQKLEITFASAPDNCVRWLATDCFQAKTWYAASDRQLFRTTNDADGWELLLDFSQPKTAQVKMFEGGLNKINVETPKAVCPSPYHKGWVALSTQNEPFSIARSPIYLSIDCGESWNWLADLDADVEDMDWLQRPGHGGDFLLLATSKGLWEIHLIFNPDGRLELEISQPIPIIDVTCATHAVSAVKVLRGQGGTARVAVAMRASFDRAAAGMQGRGGVYLSKGVELSPTGEVPNFDHLTTDSQDMIPPDIRCLGVQWCEPQNRYLLWAGRMAFGQVGLGNASSAYDAQRRALEVGGCCRWSFDQHLQNIEAGRWASKSWTGGSCLGVAFLGNRVLAATARGTVLVADIQMPTIDQAEALTDWRPLANLENIQEENFAFSCIATNQQSELVLTGCDQGVFRSQKQGKTFKLVSRRTISQWNDVVTIPPNWLLVSGEHKVNAIVEDSAESAQARSEDEAGKGS